MEFKENLIVRDKGYDVVVAGGGVAGVAAALTARRNGKKVLLLEKSTMLGGLATLGLINLFVPMCNGRGKQIIFGLAEELLRYSVKYGWAKIPPEWQDGEPAEPTDVRYIARFSPCIFAIALTSLLKDAGVDILFDVVVSQPVMAGKHCKGLVIQGKSGREFIPSPMVVDVTGDCDVLRQGGVPTQKRGNFNTYAAKGINLDSCRKAVESGRIEDALVAYSGGAVNLYGKGQPADVPLWDGGSTDDVSAYLIRNQCRLLDNIRQFPNEFRELTMLPGMVQFRTTYCINGDYTLQEEDAYRHFEDSVGAINDFERRDFLYEVPYRALTCPGYDNLITAGRSAAGSKYAWDCLRVIPPAIITGQAAGNAVCLALDSGKGIDSIDVRELQRMQAAQNVMIHFDDSLIPKDAANSGQHCNDFGHC